MNTDPIVKQLDKKIETLENKLHKLRPKIYELEEERKNLEKAKSALTGIAPNMGVPSSFKSEHRSQHQSVNSEILDFLRDYPNSKASDIEKGLGKKPGGLWTQIKGLVRTERIIKDDDKRYSLHY
jgi:chromosome segregation ATPase